MKSSSFSFNNLTTIAFFFLLVSTILIDCVYCDVEVDVGVSGGENRDVPKLKYAGMTFTGDRYCPNVTFSSASGRNSLHHIYTTGANSISLVVTQYQDYTDSTSIYPIFSNPIYAPYYTFITATDADLIEAIKYAHLLNMTVMFKLQIDLVKSPSGTWRGEIAMKSESDWDAWFASYTTTLMHYVTISQTYNVELFSVSCELLLTNSQDKRWRKVIETVRANYKGILTDSANWGGEEVGKTWWDALDFIGVDAYYFGPNGNTKMTYDEIVSKWAPVVSSLEALSKKFNKPIVFTEIGFCPGPCGRGIVITDDDLNLQATYYKATLDVWSPLPWFQGIYWWNWVTDNAFGVDKNTWGCMSPAYKPTEQILRQYYKAVLPQPAPPTESALCVCTL